MAYSTIPEEPSADDSLLPKPKTNLKRLAGGAAVASFVLGIMAATAIASAGVSRGAALSAVDSAHHVITGNTQIKLLSGAVQRCTRHTFDFHTGAPDPTPSARVLLTGPSKDSSA